MRNRLRARLKKLEEEVLPARQVIMIWHTGWGPKDIVLGPDKFIDSFTRPLPSEGFEVRRFPYLISEEVRAWVISNWDRIIPEARSMLLDKDEELRSRFSGGTARERVSHEGQGQ